MTADRAVRRQKMVETVLSGGPWKRGNANSTYGFNHRCEIVLGAQSYATTTELTLLTATQHRV